LRTNNLYLQQEFADLLVNLDNARFQKSKKVFTNLVNPCYQFMNQLA